MNSLTITIIVIFVTAIIVAYLKATWRDRCLKDMEKFPVILILKDGKAVWGTLELESSGLLLRYSKPHKSGSHFETGFILYRTEYASIKTIYRIPADLDEAQRRRRELRTFSSKSGLLVTVRKTVRNFFAAVRDAIVESMKLLIGQVTPKSSVLSGKEKYVNKMGESFVDYIGNSYDPLLEKLIGKRVVYERFENDAWQEYTGILKNYTKDFIEIINAITPIMLTFPVKPGKSTAMGIAIETKDNHVIITNNRQTPVKLLTSEKPLILQPGENTEITHVENVSVELSEEVDVIFPRSEAIVRHTVD
ncbi:MAG: hypothetical protein J7J09_05855 [Kosmotoga sp.]|uniref:hypothetical protein n=1 Tax=Kosmotoga sp. TaxID=1955248 RepID=UPI0025C5FD92|nr:hypothetical protein [Kosmotoga sp.]MCD6160128.1 hypothetical protein [Kosmotoga sp.]